MAKIPINISTGSIQKEEYIVGIDFGTTNSLIAIVHPETKIPIVLKDIDNTTLVPSIVYFEKNEAPIIGNEAKEKQNKDSLNAISSIKRLIGKSLKEAKQYNSLFNDNDIYENENDGIKIKINETLYSPIELSAFIFKELKKRSEHILKVPIKKAVVTVPAYYNDSQRQATKDAGTLAGLEIIRIINEPTAASLAYGIGLDKNHASTIAVYDLGGGTFDLSILKITNGIFEVLATNGNTQLGGDDIDKSIFDFWVIENQINQKDINNPKFIQSLRLKAEEAKKWLSKEKVFVQKLFNYELKLTQEQFKKILTPLINETIYCFKNALKDAQVKIEDLDNVIMVGGSTRTTFIKEAIAKFIGKPVNDNLNPDEVVALGAAIQADILAGNNKDMLLLDITPLSLGIETIGGLMDVLIPRNSKIPTKMGRQYTTHKDGQSGIVIAAYQGERDQVQNNRKLGEFVLKGIPNMPAGFPKIEIIFEINVDGILKVSAKEQRTGIQQSVEIKSQQGIDDNEVEKMLLESLENASEDIATRAIIESTNEAEGIIATTQKFLEKNKVHLSQDETTNTTNAIKELQKALDNKNKNDIQQFTDILNKITQPYAERIMDLLISNAMKGNKII